MLNQDQFKNWILPVTLKFEGGYNNDPKDKGKETYRGISRRSNPNWPGWSLVDRLKPLNHGDIVNDRELVCAVAELYFNDYFVTNWFHLLDANIVAIQLFDFAVHGGYSVKKLQTMLNRLFNTSLVVDGQMGTKTIAAINNQKPETLAHAILTLRAQHLREVIENEPSQLRFEKGWNYRIEYLRHCIKIIQ